MALKRQETDHSKRRTKACVDIAADVDYVGKDNDFYFNDV